MIEHPNVFISSTSRDLAKYRAKVKDIVFRLGLFPIAMEEFDATERNSLQLCYDEVQKAEAFVGIYAHRYGYIPSSEVVYITKQGDRLTGDGRTSITHWEYLWAIERGVPILLYIISDTNSEDEPLAWPLAYVDEEPEKSRLNEFKALIKSKHVVDFFHSPDHLASKIATGLSKTISEKKWNIQAETWRVLTPPPPPAQFTGRLNDISSIAKLISEPGARIVIQGAGGVGKTALVKHLAKLLSPQYPGGILWATLGPEAEGVETTLSLIWRNWKQVTPQGRNSDVKDITSQDMKSWIGQAPGPVLVIIDDIWHDAPLRALLDSLPDECSVLSTTRDAQHITPKIGRRYALTYLSEPDALAMRNVSSPLDNSRRKITEQYLRLRLPRTVC